MRPDPRDHAPTVSLLLCYWYYWWYCATASPTHLRRLLPISYRRLLRNPRGLYGIPEAPSSLLRTHPRVPAARSFVGKKGREAHEEGARGGREGRGATGAGMRGRIPRIAQQHRLRTAWCEGGRGRGREGERENGRGREGEGERRGRGSGRGRKLSWG
eukprot:187241-Rhodomonas_salina.2